MMRNKKTGAPTKDVRIPRGISAVEIIRAISSTNNKKVAPRRAEEGRVKE